MGTPATPPHPWPTRTRTRSPCRLTCTRGRAGSSSVTLSRPSAGTAAIPPLSGPATTATCQSARTASSAAVRLPGPARRTQPSTQRWLPERVVLVEHRVTDGRADTGARPARRTRSPARARGAAPDRGRPGSASTSVGTSPSPRDGSGWSSVKRTARPCRARRATDRPAPRFGGRAGPSTGRRSARRQSTASAATGDVRAAARPGSTEASSPAARATTSRSDQVASTGRRG